MKQLILPVVFGASGLLIVLLSYLIKYKKQAWLIAGYNEDQVTDRDGFCNWVGGVLMCFGIYTLFTALLLWYLPEYVMYIAVAFVLADIAAVIIAIRGGRKFKKSE